MRRTTYANQWKVWRREAISLSFFLSSSFYLPHSLLSLLSLSTPLLSISHCPLSHPPLMSSTSLSPLLSLSCTPLSTTFLSLSSTPLSLLYSSPLLSCTPLSPPLLSLSL